MNRRRFLQAAGLTTIAVITGIPAQSQAEQPRQSSIVFHWESLPEGFYPRTQKEKQNIESLILEAGSFFNSKRYVPEPLDMTLMNPPVEMYFNERKNAGKFLGANTKRVILFNPKVFVSSGWTLGTSFHEQRHLYDAVLGLMPAFLFLNQQYLEVRNIHEENIGKRIWMEYLQTRDYKILEMKAEREMAESEIRAIEGEIAILTITRKMQWSSPYALLLYEFGLQNDLKESQRKLEQLNKQASQG